MRLTTNPGESATTTGVLPSRRASATAVTSVAWEVFAPRTTSTSGMRWTGLKKWNPQNRSGCASPAASSSTESDEVLVASRASGRMRASSSANTRRFTSRSSTTASMAASAQPKPSISSVTVTRAIWPSSSYGFERRFRPRSSISPRTVRSASASASGLTSRMRTRMPLRLASSAMPAPMMPVPTRPSAAIFLGSMPRSATGDFLARSETRNTRIRFLHTGPTPTRSSSRAASSTVLPMPARITSMAASGAG